MANFLLQRSSSEPAKIKQRLVSAQRGNQHAGSVRKSAYPCSTSADCSAVYSFVTKFFFDPQQLIVFGHAIAPAWCTRFDLAGVCSYRDIGNGRVLSFTRAMADHGRVIIFLCNVDRCERLRQRADLIYLDKNGIRHLLGNSFLKKFNVRDEKIVADQLDG